MSEDEEELSLDISQPLPIYKLLDMKVLEASEGKAVLKMSFQEKLTLPRGVMHGGPIATLADSAVAMALLSLVGLDTGIATINLNVNYLAPVTDEITAEANIIRKGKNVATGDVEVRGKDDNLVAKVTAAYAILG